MTIYLRGDSLIRGVQSKVILLWVLIEAVSIGLGLVSRPVIILSGCRWDRDSIYT